MQEGGGWEVLLNDWLGSRKLSWMVGGLGCHCQATEGMASGSHHMSAPKNGWWTQESQTQPGVQ